MRFVKTENISLTGFRGLFSGDFGGVCGVCVKGSVRLVEDKSYSKDGVVWRCSNRKCNKKIVLEKAPGFQASIYCWNRL